MSKTVITLYQLNELWQEHVYKETGKRIPLEIPMELAPAYASWCRRQPTAWHNQKEKRIQQMILMDIIDTHVIDYYEKTEPITFL
jgi:hypothetical protein